MQNLSLTHSRSLHTHTHRGAPTPAARRRSLAVAKQLDAQRGNASARRVTYPTGVDASFMPTYLQTTRKPIVVPEVKSTVPAEPDSSDTLDDVSAGLDSLAIDREQVDLDIDAVIAEMRDRRLPSFGWFADFQHTIITPIQAELVAVAESIETADGTSNTPERPRAKYSLLNSRKHQPGDEEVGWSSEEEEETRTQSPPPMRQQRRRLSTDSSDSSNDDTAAMTRAMAASSSPPSSPLVVFSRQVATDMEKAIMADPPPAQPLVWPSEFVSDSQPTASQSSQPEERMFTAAQVRKFGLDVMFLTRNYCAQFEAVPSTTKYRTLQPLMQQFDIAHNSFCKN